MEQKNTTTNNLTKSRRALAITIIGIVWLLSVFGYFILTGIVAYNNGTGSDIQVKVNIHEVSGNVLATDPADTATEPEAVEAPVKSILLIDKSSSMPAGYEVYEIARFDDIEGFTADIGDTKKNESRIGTVIRHALEEGYQDIEVHSDLECYPKDNLDDMRSYVMENGILQNITIRFVCAEGTTRSDKEMFEKFFSSNMDGENCVLSFVNPDGSESFVSGFEPEEEVEAETIEDTEQTTQPATIGNTTTSVTQKVNGNNDIHWYFIATMFFSIVVALILALIAQNKDTEASKTVKVTEPTETIKPAEPIPAAVVQIYPGTQAPGTVTKVVITGGNVTVEVTSPAHDVTPQTAPQKIENAVKDCPDACILDGSQSIPDDAYNKMLELVETYGGKEVYRIGGNDYVKCSLEEARANHPSGKTYIAGALKAAHNDQHKKLVILTDGGIYDNVPEEVHFEHITVVETGTVKDAFREQIKNICDTCEFISL